MQNQQMQQLHQLQQLQHNNQHNQQIEVAVKNAMESYFYIQSLFDQ